MRPKKPKKKRMAPEEASMAGAEWATEWCAIAADPSRCLGLTPFPYLVRIEERKITPRISCQAFGSSALAILKMQRDHLLASGVSGYTIYGPFAESMGLGMERYMGDFRWKNVK